MRVQLVDPRGDVTPYDHALSAALARRGAEVELVTSRFVYGPTPEVWGYAVSERFYRLAVRRGLEARRSRQALRLLEHVPDMLRYRRHAEEADVRHFQWLPLEDSIMAPLHEQARTLPGTVRFVTRYITEAEIPAFFRRADLVVLSYRSVDQSGVLYIGLAFGKPMVISAVGGFAELGEEHGAARLVPPGEPEPLAAAIRELLADPAERERLGERAAAAAAGPYSWDLAAERTLALYEELLA